MKSIITILIIGAIFLSCTTAEDCGKMCAPNSPIIFIQGSNICICDRTKNNK